MLSLRDLSEYLDACAAVSRPNLYNREPSSDARFKGRAASGGTDMLPK